MELSREEKRKYAIAMRRVELSIDGYPISLFREISLTTREGDDQSTGRFKRDLGQLIRWFRKLGYKVEYCGCYEVSPNKHLLHWHGLLRVKGGYFPISRKMLGDRWNEIHHAFAVAIVRCYKMETLIKYITKHMMKDYLVRGDLIRNKFLVSRGWKRGGGFVNRIEVEFKKWWLNGTGDSWLPKVGFQNLNKIVRGWCVCGKVELTTSFGRFSVVGERIEADIFGID